MLVRDLQGAIFYHFGVVNDVQEMSVSKRSAVSPTKGDKPHALRILR